MSTTWYFVSDQWYGNEIIGIAPNSQAAVELWRRVLNIQKYKNRHICICKITTDSKNLKTHQEFYNNVWKDISNESEFKPLLPITDEDRIALEKFKEPLEMLPSSDEEAD